MARRQVHFGATVTLGRARINYGASKANSARSVRRGTAFSFYSIRWISGQKKEKGASFAAVGSIFDSPSPVCEVRSDIEAIKRKKAKSHPANRIDRFVKRTMRVIIHGPMAIRVKNGTVMEYVARIQRYGKAVWEFARQALRQIQIK